MTVPVTPHLPKSGRFCEKSISTKAANALDLTVVFVSPLQVCDGSGDPCDAVCGGGGCGTCGGSSCDKGAVTKADNALDLALKAEALLKVKEGNAQSLNQNVSLSPLP